MGEACRGCLMSSQADESDGIAGFVSQLFLCFSVGQLLNGGIGGDAFFDLVSLSLSSQLSCFISVSLSPAACYCFG